MNVWLSLGAPWQNPPHPVYLAVYELVKFPPFQHTLLSFIILWPAIQNTLKKNRNLKLPSLEDWFDDCRCLSWSLIDWFDVFRCPSWCLWTALAWLSAFQIGVKYNAACLLLMGRRGVSRVILYCKRLTICYDVLFFYLSVILFIFFAD